MRLNFTNKTKEFLYFIIIIISLTALQFSPKFITIENIFIDTIYKYILFSEPSNKVFIVRITDDDIKKLGVTLNAEKFLQTLKLIHSTKPLAIGIYMPLSNQLKTMIENTIDSNIIFNQKIFFNTRTNNYEIANYYDNAKNLNNIGYSFIFQSN